MAGNDAFSDRFRWEFEELLRWRRDVRHFKQEPLAEGLLETILSFSRFAPSVGLSEPWRWVRVSQAARRAKIRANFERANKLALSGYTGEQAALYARLKLEGLESAPAQLAVFADRATQQGGGLGRQTMPEMVEYSVVAAVTTLWLVARAYGVGMGWVSILDPAEVNGILDVPEEWRLVAYLCLGYPERESLLPELEEAGWERRRSDFCPIER